jgi:hypothetical protein
MARLMIVMGVLAALLGPLPARGQAPRPGEEQFVAVGVMLVDGAPGLAWLLEPRLTQNRPMAVRQGESIGPYQVTRILDDRVELTGPGGPVWVPLLTTGGSVVASAGPIGPSAAPATTPTPTRSRASADVSAAPAMPAGASPLPAPPRNPLAQPIDALKRRIEAVAQQQREAAEAQRAILGENPTAPLESAEAPTPTAPAVPPVGTLPSGPRVSYPPQGSLMDFLKPQ